MQRMQRQAGKFMKRSADEQDVATVMEQFVLADKLLDTFMDAVRSFQTAWRAILGGQLEAAQLLEIIYQPIYDAESNNNTETDPMKLDKAVQYKAFYSELSGELEQETLWIQTKLLDPAMDAKSSINPLKKVLQKRENLKLDYERYSSRTDHARQKGARNPKEETILAKHESDLQQSLVLYRQADETIKRTVPPVIDAIQALVPLLMNTQIMLQHALVGQWYTVLHEYCQRFGFPSPAPPMEEVTDLWDREFSPLRSEVEQGLRVLATGKTVHLPMRIEEKQKSYTGLGIRSKVPGMRSPSQPQVPQLGRPPAQAQITYPDEQDEAPPPRPARPGRIASAPRVPSSTSLHAQQSLPEDDEAPPPKPPRPGGAGGPMIPASSKPRTASSLSVPQASPGATIPRPSPPLGMALPGMTNPLSPGPGLANGSRRSSASTTFSSVADEQYRQDYIGSQRNPSTTSVASSIAGKKKPPPPPVKRRVTAQDVFVVAMYDFAGQTAEDLPFREGDRIKVVKKTDSTDDWWTGELRGRTGSFPANYVEVR